MTMMMMTVTISEDENDGDDKSYSLLVGHSYNIQLFWERLIVGKNVHVTIPRGNMWHDQYTVPNTVAVKATCKRMSMASCAILSNFIEKIVNSKSPAIPFGIVVCSFSDNLSRNSCLCILINHRCLLSWPQNSPQAHLFGFTGMCLCFPDLL